VTVHEIRIDPVLPLAREPQTGHNRWHPGISPAITADPGDEVVLSTRDALDGQIGPDSVAADVTSIDISVVHPLTGPVFITGAEPGDLLQVEILQVETGSFGYTVQSPGFGFLRADFPGPFLARWQMADGLARSDDVPGIRIPGRPFMGTMGVAPSQDLLARIMARERALAAAGGMVDLPEPRGAVPGTGPVPAGGLRTIPPRENAGNMDIKQLTVGTQLLIPVFVPGALFSAGDAHFAQGDGEACGQAIETRATVRLRFGLRKGEAAASQISQPQFRRMVPAPQGGPYHATTGICLHRDGANAAEDLTLAARNALRAMISHLTSGYGYTPQQAYVICSVAVDLAVSQAVDVPNVLVSAFLPLEIFDPGGHG
jgi:formamidase